MDPVDWNPLFEAAIVVGSVLVVMWGPLLILASGNKNPSGTMQNTPEPQGRRPPAPPPPPRPRR